MTRLFAGFRLLKVVCSHNTEFPLSLSSLHAFLSLTPHNHTRSLSPYTLHRHSSNRRRKPLTATPSLSPHGFCCRSPPPPPPSIASDSPPSKVQASPPSPQSDRASLPPLFARAIIASSHASMLSLVYSLASSLSIIGYLRYHHEVEPESTTDNADRGSYVPPILGEDTDTALETGSLNCYCEPKFRTVALVWGYALQIIFQYWSFLRNTRNDSALYVILLLDFSNSFACQSTIMKWNIFQHGEKLDMEKVWLIMIL
ncbi:hypothetical protein ACS0TY_024935 [Phlomoides rotata]